MRVMAIIDITASAEPRGQLLVLPNCCWMMLPIIRPLGPPTRLGVT